VDDDVDAVLDRFHELRTCKRRIDDCQYLVMSIVVVSVTSTAELTEFLQVEHSQQRVARRLGIQQLSIIMVQNYNRAQIHRQS